MHCLIRKKKRAKLSVQNSELRNLLGLSARPIGTLLANESYYMPDVLRWMLHTRGKAYGGLNSIAARREISASLSLRRRVAAKAKCALVYRSSPPLAIFRPNHVYGPPAG